MTEFIVSKMKNRKKLINGILKALLLAVVLIAFTSAASAGPIGFGTVTSGSSDNFGELDSYTFSANANDIILLRYRTDFQSGPKISLSSPSMSNLINYSGNFDTKYFEQVIKLDQTGQYTVLLGANEKGNAGVDYRIGSYSLFVQRLNNPGQAKPINFGENISGSINKEAEMQTYTFSANANDIINVAIRTAFHDINGPRTILYSPSTSNLVDFSGPNTDLFEQSIKLDQTGQYTLLVGENQGDTTGSYVLNVQTNGKPMATTPSPTTTLASSPSAASTDGQARISNEDSLIDNFARSILGCKQGFRDCSAPQGDCETNVWADNNNCGECGKQCPSGYFCLLGSCSENTKEKKQQLITGLTQEYDKSFQSGNFEDARYYLLRIKDTYMELDQNDKASETSAQIEEVDKQIDAKAQKDERIKELMSVGGSILFAVAFFIYKRKSKDALKELLIKMGEAVGVFIIAIILQFVILNYIHGKIYAAVAFALPVSLILGIISYKLLGKTKFGTGKKTIISSLVIISAFIIVGIIGYLFLWWILG